MSTFIGTFRATQQRERLLRRNTYSHVVVVFDDGLILIEASPLRDAAAAAVHFVPVPLPHHIKIARHLLQIGPKYGHVEDNLSRLPALAPEAILAAFPGHVRGVDNERIHSATLRSIPPELRIKYQGRDGDRHQLWLKLPLFERVDRVASLVSAALGDRFRQQSTSGGCSTRRWPCCPGGDEAAATGCSSSVP